MSSHHLLNWDVFPIISLVVIKRTQHFLEAILVVAVACVDLNLKVLLFWVSFCLSYKLIHCFQVVRK